MKKSRLVIFCLLFQFIEIIHCGGLYVESPNSIRGSYTVGPFPGLLPEEFNISGYLVAANPIIGCSYNSLVNKKDLIGNIVIVSEDECDPWQKVAAIQEAEGLGVLYITFDGLLGSYYPTHRGQQPPGMWIPMLAISYTYGNMILDVVQEPQDVFVIFSTPDGNPTKEWIDGAPGVLFQLSLELYGFFCLSFAIYKLWYFVRFLGWQLSVTQVCLELEIIANLVRIVYLVDPINFHGYFNHLATATLVNLSTPFTLTSTLLISFYWLEMLTRWSSNARKILQNITKLKIPFAITVVILFVLLLLGMITTGLNLPFPSLLTINTVVVFIVAILVALFFIISGIRILRTLTSVKPEEHSKRWKSLSRVTILLISCGASFIIFGIFLLLLDSELGQATIQGAVFCWWMLFAMLDTIGLTQIIVFQLPKKSTDSPTSNSKNSNVMEESLTSVQQA
jgi:hypothetical protein